MKRKFSFNLAPVVSRLDPRSPQMSPAQAHPVPPQKVPMKPEPSPKHAPEPSPAHQHSQPQRKHHSKDSISTLSSPYINRRALDPQTERELRRACALILQNFKPSDHDIIDKDPKLDFKGLGRRRDHKPDPTDITTRKPTGAPAEPRGPHDARKLGHKADLATKSYPDLAIRANTARRRGEPADPAEKEMASRKVVKSPASELPRSATARTETDSDGLGTPLTGSTDTHLNNGSTAPTSAAVTSGRSSTRMSRQYESAAAAADAQAAEWMRHEREKRKQQLVSQPQSAPQPAARPPSRARSIRDGLRDYIFPGSSSINSSQSNESLRAANNRPSSSQGPKRSGSFSGWRSWGLQRMSSSRSSSRPGTSRARLENQELDPRNNEVNLNRELPPLPSLDSWKDAERPQNEHATSHAQGAHIATLMRPQEQKRQEYAAGIRQQHRRSGSDTLAVRYTNAYPQASSAAVARSPSHAKHSAQPTSPRGRAGSRLDTSRDFDEMVSALSSSRNLEEQLKFRVSGHTHQHQHSTSTLSQLPSAKMSTDFRPEGPPNFSRKISMDVAPTQQGFAYPNIVHVAHPPKDEQKSRLRKVFSGWMLKKEKKDDWMQRIEKEGVKEGVMIQDEAALPPVVRY